jgi:hypothetical protein
MTQAQRNAISSPAAGLIIWCTNCGTSGEFQGYNGTTWTNLIGGTASAGIITGLTCGSATNNGTLTSGTAASGVSSVVPYTGGNGASHSGQTVTSTGVTGLTATLSAGTFASGSGSLTYTISGTPASSGTATFALNIGGQTCSLTRTVNAASPTYPGGSVHCITGGAAIVDVTNPTTGKTWMDRNLGASQVATSSTDANSYGDLYQWGRFSDGHQCRNSSTTTTTSSGDSPGHGNFILFYDGTNYVWRTTSNDNLWQGVSFTNNPCPSGYRLPTQSEFVAEIATWGSQDSPGAFGSVLKLPLADLRSAADGLIYTGSGRYWSSTISALVAVRLNFSASANSTNTSTGYRGTGFSIRCIKD